jgi:hypothetical protein
MLSTPGGGEVGGGLVTERAARSALVLVGALTADGFACFGEGSEPVLVQGLVAQLAVEAPDIGVLHRLACLDQPQHHAVAVGPAVDRVARELPVLDGAGYIRQAVELADPVEHSRHVLARNAIVDTGVDRFLGVAIDDRQAPEHPTKRLRHFSNDASLNPFVNPRFTQGCSGLYLRQGPSDLLVSESRLARAQFFHRKLGSTHRPVELSSGLALYHSNSAVQIR